MGNNEVLFKNTDKPIYKDFFFKNKFVKNLGIHHTIWKGKDSNNSFSLRDKNTTKEEILNILQNTFV